MGFRLPQLMPGGIQRVRYGGDDTGGGLQALRGGLGAPAPRPQAPPSNPFAGLMPSTGQLSSFAPAPYSDFGAVPYITPTYMQAAQANPADQSGYLRQFEQLLGSSLAPQYQHATQGLDQDLAARGIFNSGAGVQAHNDLDNQFFGTAAGAMEPLVSQFAGYNQDTQMADLANRQGANQYNAGVANTATAANAGAYGNTVASDQSNYNAFLNQLMQYGMGISQGLTGSYLGTYGADPSAGGILSQGLAGAGSAYSSALGAGDQNAGNLSRIFGNAAGAFAKPPGQSLNLSNVPTGWEAATGQLPTAVG